ncbi:MAG: transcription elongation factor GreA [Clostridia bacterium]|nr:transcription elongation factor GreA [Clostridia bacterium]
MAEVFMTTEGYKELEDRLNELKTVKRQEISNKISEARGFGDISENAEYDAAKDEQALVEGQILEIEAKLREAVIISEADSDTSVVKVGFTVQVSDQTTKRKMSYQIVGITEVDPFANVPRISNESPLGSALLGKKLGQEVEILLPPDSKNKKKIKILNITK